MDQTNIIECIYDGMVVPASVLRQQKKKDQYGHVEGLPDEELADPDELERVVHKEMWWPILSLPQPRRECPIRPNMDEDGRIEWGAFGTVDFNRYRPEFDKLRYKVEMLKEKLKDLVFMLTTMSARVPSRAKYKILKLVRAGLLDMGDIADNQMYFFAEMYMRAWSLRKEIEQLQEKRRQRQERKMEAWLAE